MAFPSDEERWAACRRRRNPSREMRDEGVRGKRDRQGLYLPAVPEPHVHRGSSPQECLIPRRAQGDHRQRPLGSGLRRSWCGAATRRGGDTSPDACLAEGPSLRSDRLRHDTNEPQQSTAHIEDTTGTAVRTATSTCLLAATCFPGKPRSDATRRVGFRATGGGRVNILFTAMRDRCRRIVNPIACDGRN